jgi:alpha-glucosidase
MQKLAYETQAAYAPGKRPYVVTRGGGAGIARYGQTWTGDNETAWKTLRFNLTQGLNMSLSGLFNIGHDVGGFHGPVPGPELFCRFVEFCALWPRMVMNSWKEDGTVNTPWMHPEVLPQVRAVIALRHRLIPYLYTQMWRASCQHLPAVRPLLWDFPKDAAARAVEDAFMLGPDLLVAPVLEQGVANRAVYLPAHPGGWYDWHDRTHHDGGQTVTVSASLGRLPLLARAGSIIPVADGSETAAIVFGTSQDAGSGFLYVDDGETVDWRRHGDVIAFSLGRTEAGLTLDAHIRAQLQPINVRAVGVPNLRLSGDGLVLKP